MNYRSWDDKMPERTFPDTGAILAKRISDALRKEEAQEKVQGREKSDFEWVQAEWVRAEQHKKSSLTESGTPLSVDRDLFQRDMEQSLRRVAELEEAVIVDSRKAVFELWEIALRDSVEDVRVAAVEALGMLGEQIPVIPLLLALRDSFWDVRAAAAQALGKLGERTPIRHLIAHLKQEPDMSVREAIVRVLGQQGKATPTDVIVDILLQDESWLVRETAAWALGELKEYAPLPALIYALRFDPSEQVRATVAASLGRSGRQGAMTSLFEALKDDDSDVQEAATLALQQLDREEETQISSSNFENDDLSFLEKWLPSDMSMPKALQWQKEWQTFSTLTEYIKDKRGGVKAELKETTYERVLMINCFYERPQESFQETLLPSIQGMSRVEPIEAALQSRDEIVQTVVKRAFEIRGKREWFDLLVVSFVVSQGQVEAERTCLPLRIVMCSMSCYDVRQNDALLLDQLSERWHDLVNEPSICNGVHDLADLKVWYQPVA